MKASLRVFPWLLVLVAVARGEQVAPVATPATTGLPTLAAADTVRGNLWLAQALFGEVIRAAAAAVPTDGDPVTLRPLARNEANELFTAVARSVLVAAGHAVYLDESNLPAVTQASGQGSAVAGGDTLTAAPARPTNGYLLRYRLESVSLSYPHCGRRFGLWRQWVDRELEVVALISILEEASGRLLFDERVVRGYADRVPAAGFASVRSGAYGFTDAELGESGWRRHIEQAVVLGTLAGLVAVYFANTGS